MTAKEVSAIDRKITECLEIMSDTETDFVGRQKCEGAITALSQVKDAIQSEKQDYAKQLLEKVRVEIEKAEVHLKQFVIMGQHPCYSCGQVRFNTELDGEYWCEDCFKRVTATVYLYQVASIIESVIKSEDEHQT